MALRLTAILLLVLFVAMQFGGLETPSGPFVEAPGSSPDTAVLAVAPLDAPLEPARVATPAPPLTVPERLADAPEPDGGTAARVAATDPAPAEAPEPIEAARTALDLAVIDADATRESLQVAPVTAPAAAPLSAPSLATLADAPEDTAAIETVGGDMAEVTGSAVNLRAGPSTGDAVLGRAIEGDRVEWVADPAPGWAMIRHPDIDGNVYMSSAYLRRLSN